MGEVRTSAGLRPALAASLTSSTASSRSSFSSASLPIILLYLGRSFFGTTPLYRKHARVRERVRRPWRRGRAAPPGRPRSINLQSAPMRSRGKHCPPPTIGGPTSAPACARRMQHTHTHTHVCVCSRVRGVRGGPWAHHRVICTCGRGWQTCSRENARQCAGETASALLAAACTRPRAPDRIQEVKDTEVSGTEVRSDLALTRG
jgi:hypothetical protein